MKQDYYKATIQDIKELIKTNPSKAIKKLEVELNMPYIPEKYEVQFNQLLDEIKYKLKQDMVVNNELSKEEVLEIINQNNSVKMPMAIAKLKDLNLRAMLDDLQKIIQNNSISNVVKTIIYEYCIEQDIDFNFSWNGMIINPKIVGSTIQLSAYQKAYLEIEKTIVKNPSLKTIAFSFLELYVLNTFPTFIDEKDDLGSIIIAIAFESIGLPQINMPNHERMQHIKKYLNTKNK